MLRRTAASSFDLGRALRRSPLLLVLAAALLLATPVGGSAQTQPLFQFGRSGGNIEPFSVTINADGTLEHTGPVHLAKPDTRLTQARLAGLLRYARAQHFWSLPTRTSCSRSLPDFASPYVTIHSAGKTRTVTVRGGCRPRFTRIYRALSAAATVTS